jgi:hypothetical protein
MKIGALFCGLALTTLAGSAMAASELSAYADKDGYIDVQALTVSLSTTK